MNNEEKKGLNPCSNGMKLELMMEWREQMRRTS